MGISQGAFQCPETQAQLQKGLHALGRAYLTSSHHKKKRDRKDYAKSLLKIYDNCDSRQRNKNVTGDETQVYFFFLKPARKTHNRGSGFLQEGICLKSFDKITPPRTWYFIPPSGKLNLLLNLIHQSTTKNWIVHSIWVIQNHEIHTYIQMCVK